MHKLSSVIVIILVALIIQSCSSGGGAASNQPASSTGNTSIAAATKILLTGSTQCPNGGVNIDTGIDDNNNGVLDANEIDNTSYVCNGQKGINALVKAESEAAGTHCAIGGQKILIGSDSNANSALDSNEVTSTSYICNSVTSSSGPSSLLKISSEPGGANCANGGIKVESGLDASGNGILDSAEIAATNFVCNGSDGIDGTNSLIKTTAEPTGANCANGGVKVEAGLDANGNKALDASEVNSTKYVCNGSSGMLFRITTESAGTNCADGGIKIESGSDTNGNNNLDTAEITSTNFICNGSSGSGGQDTQSYNNTYCSTSTTAGSQLNFACDGSAFKDIYDYYPLGSCSVGTPYKTCAYESCSKSLSHGYYRRQKNSCNDGSPSYETEHLSCNSGYVLVNNDCVDFLSTLTSELTCTDAGKYWWNNSCHDGCQSDQIATSRGCETPITTCTPYQTIQDNQCVDISFTSITGNICGEYNEPVKILAGDHLVTCDSTFDEKAVIEPGARLLVDNYWWLKFTDIYFKGTPTSHIVFDKSAGNLSGGWKNLMIKNGAYKYHYANGYLSGNYMSYVDIGGFLNSSVDEVDIKNTFVENIGLTGTYDLNMQDVYVTNSNFSLGRVYFDSNYSTKKPNYLLNSTITASSGITMYDTLAAWSTFNSNLSAYNTYIGTAVLFSNIKGVTCSTSDPAYISGNKTSGTVSATCNQSDNSTLNVSDKIGTYILNEPTNTMYLNLGKDFSVHVLNKSGWLTSSSVIWGATYDVDGVVYNYPSTWSGYSPSISFDTKEAYTLNINSVDSSNQLIGKKSINRINVW